MVFGQMLVVTLVIALSHLQARRKIQPGQSVLINGARDGLGSIGVQLAKANGARATGVDSTGTQAMIRALAPIA